MVDRGNGPLRRVEPPVLASNLTPSNQGSNSAGASLEPSAFRQIVDRVFHPPPPFSLSENPPAHISGRKRSLPAPDQPTRKRLILDQHSSNNASGTEAGPNDDQVVNDLDGPPTPGHQPPLYQAFVIPQNSLYHPETWTHAPHGWYMVNTNGIAQPPTVMEQIATSHPSVPGENEDMLNDTRGPPSQALLRYPPHPAAGYEDGYSSDTLVPDHDTGAVESEDLAPAITQVSPMQHSPAWSQMPLKLPATVDRDSSKIWAGISDQNFLDLVCDALPGGDIQTGEEATSCSEVRDQSLPEAGRSGCESSPRDMLDGGLSDQDFLDLDLETMAALPRTEPIVKTPKPPFHLTMCEPQSDMSLPGDPDDEFGGVSDQDLIDAMACTTPLSLIEPGPDSVSHQVNVRAQPDSGPVRHGMSPEDEFAGISDQDLLDAMDNRASPGPLTVATRLGSARTSIPIKNGSSSPIQEEVDLFQIEALQVSESETKRVDTQSPQPCSGPSAQRTTTPHPGLPRCAPFVRPAPPKPVQKRPALAGVTPYTLLRTCFRIGEAFNYGHEAGCDVVVELYARVLWSHRVGVKQLFKFADIFYDQRPPYLEGCYQCWKGNELWDRESQPFLAGDKKLARVIGRMKQTGRGAKLLVFNIWEAEWADIEYSRAIVCS